MTLSKIIFERIEIEINLEIESLLDQGEKHPEYKDTYYHQSVCFKIALNIIKDLLIEEETFWKGIYACLR